MKEIPDTYEDLTSNFKKNLPTNYKRVDIDANFSVEESIKMAERSKRRTC